MFSTHHIRINKQSENRLIHITWRYTWKYSYVLLFLCMLLFSFAYTFSNYSYLWVNTFEVTIQDDTLPSISIAYISPTRPSLSDKIMFCHVNLVDTCKCVVLFCFVLYDKLFTWTDFTNIFVSTETFLKIHN